MNDIQLHHGFFVFRDTGVTKETAEFSCGLWSVLAARLSKLEYVTKSNEQEFKISNNMIQTAANIP